MSLKKFLSANKMHYLKLLLFNFSLFLAIVGLLELVSFLVLARYGFSEMLFFSVAPHKAQMMDYDSRLGWKHFESDFQDGGYRTVNDCIVFTSGLPETTNPLIIGILGGSTTDNISYEHNWPFQLSLKLDSLGFNHVIYNCGVGGYNTNQELLKLKRDLLPLNPDIVISYSGVNECQFANPVNFRGAPTSIFPNLGKLLSFLISYEETLKVLDTKPTDYPSSYDGVAFNWFGNLMKMRTLCMSDSVDFIAVLQPALGVGKYDYSPSEYSRRYEYYEDFYQYATPYSMRHQFILDFTNIFENHTNVYTDDCHVREFANRIIAERIIEHLDTTVTLLK